MNGYIERLWGSGDLSVVFGAGAPKAPCPWPRAGRSKTAPPLSRMLTPDFIVGDVHLSLIDPRELWCSQPWVLLEHARYYGTGRWERTGITSADRANLANRYPIVVLDDRQRPVILSGHHRALAALIDGRPLLARRPDRQDRAIAVRPHLLVGTRTDLPATRCSSAQEAATVMTLGGLALVSSRELARRALDLLDG